ncbi:hypothetical protein SNEBB_004375 [Seison nebaliae]|nr:hypothetical protein SNEBB_004375 [Seison nebaliae]
MVKRKVKPITVRASIQRKKIKKPVFQSVRKKSLIAKKKRRRIANKDNPPRKHIDDDDDDDDDIIYIDEDGKKESKNFMRKRQNIFNTNIPVKFQKKKPNQELKKKNHLTNNQSTIIAKKSILSSWFSPKIEEGEKKDDKIPNNDNITTSNMKTNIETKIKRNIEKNKKEDDKTKKVIENKNKKSIEKTSPTITTKNKLKKLETISTIPNKSESTINNNDEMDRSIKLREMMKQWEDECEDDIDNMKLDNDIESTTSNDHPTDEDENNIENIENCIKTVKKKFFRSVVIDGMNVMNNKRRNRNDKSDIWKLISAVKYFHDKANVIVVMPLRVFSSLKQNGNFREISYIIRLIQMDNLVLTPHKVTSSRSYNSYDDRYILDVALLMNAIIISNDSFRDLSSTNERYENHVRNLLVGFSFLHRVFLPASDPNGRNGKHLKELLNES